MSEEKYILPDEEHIVVDVGQGKIVDEENLSHWERLKLSAEKANIKIKDPKPDCKKCYGRGYIGYEKNVPVACKCIFTKEDLEASKNQFFMNRAKSRRIDKINNLMKNETISKKMLEMGLIQTDKNTYLNKKTGKKFKYDLTTKNFIKI